MKWVKGELRHEFVWEGDTRPEVHDRGLKIIQEQFYSCTNCKAERSCQVRDTVCGDCLHNEEYKKKQKKFQSLSFKQYADAVAFGNDPKTGKPLALDKKGNRVRPEDTVYSNHKKDPFGWKAIGKKVKDPEYGTSKYYRSKNER